MNLYLGATKLQFVDDEILKKNIEATLVLRSNIF